MWRVRGLHHLGVNLAPRRYPLLKPLTHQLTNAPPLSLSLSPSPVDTMVSTLLEAEPQELKIKFQPEIKSRDCQKILFEVIHKELVRVIDWAKVIPGECCLVVVIESNSLSLPPQPPLHCSSRVLTSCLYFTRRL